MNYALNGYKYDHIIKNDGSIEDLHKKIDELMKQINS